MCAHVLAVPPLRVYSQMFWYDEYQGDGNVNAMRVKMAHVHLRAGDTVGALDIFRRGSAVQRSYHHIIS